MRFCIHDFGLILGRAMLLVMLALQATVSAFAQSNDSLSADQVKAGFIYNFTKYVEWPAAPDSDPGHFHICIAGTDGVTEQLESAVHGKVAAGRTIVVRHIGETTDIAGCEILYVGSISRKNQERLAASGTGQPVLTVGSTPGFLLGAGMVTFVVLDNRVRFDINPRLADKANIHFDSRILALARSTTPEVSR